MKTFRRRVNKGSQTGRKIGFPTINLNVGDFKNHYSPGVYGCRVKIKGEEYKGGLYFGPKMHHSGDVLEIHLLDFSGCVYDCFVSVQVGKRIRNPKKFTSLEDLKKQISLDLEKGV